MILVTGGTGLVGSHLLLNLLIEGNKIRAIYRKGSDLKAVKKIFGYYIPNEEAKFLYEQIEWKEASLGDIPALTEAFEGVKNVYLCAALVSFDPADNEALRKTNIEGTANIANLSISRKIEKLCYISSIATLGLTVGEAVITENFTWLPEKDHSEYAISKHGAEMEIWRASQEGIPVVILNPGVILGPGFWDKGTGLIFSRIDNGLNYSFPKTTGFVGVKDVANLAVHTMESSISNEQFIIVSENLSFDYIFKTVAVKMGKKPPEKQLKPWMVYIGWIFQSIASVFGQKQQLRKGDHHRLFENSFFSNEKVKNRFSYSFQPMAEVISKVVEVYKEDKMSKG